MLKDKYSIELLKPNNEVELLSYNKNKEKFFGDYALVRAFSKDIRYANQMWLGVINQDFETVLPFCLWKDVRLFSNHIALVTLDNGITYQIDLEQKRVVSYFGSYKDVDSDLLVIQRDERSSLVGLYSMQQKKVLSNWFDYISEFEKVNGKRVAFGVRKIKNTKNIDASFVCYIDDKGEICSEVYQTLDGESLGLHKQNFEDFVDLYEKKYNKLYEEDRVKKRLKLTISKKEE